MDDFYSMPLICYVFFNTVLLPLKLDYRNRGHHALLNPGFFKFIAYFLLCCQVSGLAFLIYLGVKTTWWIPLIFFLAGLLLPAFLLMSVSKDAFPKIALSSLILAPILLVIAFRTIA